MKMCHIRSSAYIYLFWNWRKKIQGYSHTMVLWSVSLISGLSIAAVVGAVSHLKPASARCPYFFCSSTYLKAGLAPAENMFNTALLFKYLPFIFEYCLSVLAKIVEYATFSLLSIPWITASGFVYLKNKGPKTLHAFTAIQGDTKEMSWITWGV
jgi:hypothetical protein